MVSFEPQLNSSLPSNKFGGMDMKKFGVIVGLKDGSWKRIDVYGRTRNDAVNKVYKKHGDEIEFVCGVVAKSES